jgi:tetratricopeptide (TPR) repeat protein
VEINPDNIDVLPLLAWAIPRRITTQTPDGAQQLAKAQDYAKHGIQLLTTMPKPEEMDDAAFTKAKNEKLAMCHDGIGVAEVKTGKYDDAINELNQSVALSATPDPVDFYLLGVANQVTSHFTDSIAAFTKCSAEGPLQTQCKAGLDEVKKKSENSLEAPK